MLVSWVIWKLAVGKIKLHYHNDPEPFTLSYSANPVTPPRQNSATNTTALTIVCTTLSCEDCFNYWFTKGSHRNAHINDKLSSRQTLGPSKPRSVPFCLPPCPSRFGADMDHPFPLTNINYRLGWREVQRAEAPEGSHCELDWLTLTTGKDL